jgi:hypothetical protein
MWEVHIISNDYAPKNRSFHVPKFIGIYDDYLTALTIAQRESKNARLSYTIKKIDGTKNSTK